jgi:imidazolonepropionase-like amidohydrolase
LLAIRTSNLIDGTGRALEDLEDMVVLVQGERITKVGKAEGVEIPEDARLIDALGRTVMPGMIDAHVHVMGSGDPKEQASGLRIVRESEGTLALKSHANAKRDLEAGFTAIRDVGCFAYVDVALRNAINSDWVDGPRMRVGGQPLTVTGGHFDLTKGLASHVSIVGLTNTADSAEEGRRAARTQLKMGVDFIKIAATSSEYVRRIGGLYSQEMALETMRAICEVAHWAGRKVAAHCMVVTVLGTLSWLEWTP